jgi:uncharacterized protein (DUF1501 family)
MPGPCRSHRQAEAARAAAGRGLPSIEPGQPAPAGTGMSRRALLGRASGLALAVYGASHLPLAQLEDSVAHAAAPAAAPGGTVLVSVFLGGGLDGLGLLAPVGDPQYRKLRSGLLIGDEARPFREDDRLRWHPAAEPLRELHEQGVLSVLPAIGYANPDQSHFTSRHYWEVGSLDHRGTTGWMGRLLDRVGDDEHPLQGLSLDGTLSPALATSRVPVAAVADPSEYSFWAHQVWGDVDDLMRESAARIGRAHAASGDPALAVAGRVAQRSMALYDQLGPVRPKDGEQGAADASPVRYPTAQDSSFPEKLRALAAMLGAGLPLRCVAVDGPGQYDTHDRQAPTLQRNLELLSQTLRAFQADLTARGLADRVLVHVWSEFGRRAQANGSGGTDHGAAGVSLLLGSRVRGSMIGEFPGLSQLDRDGNLRATTDFRALYASIAEQWLGVDGAAILPDAGRVGRYVLLR